MGDWELVGKEGMIVWNGAPSTIRVFEQDDKPALESIQEQGGTCIDSGRVG